MVNSNHNVSVFLTACQSFYSFIPLSLFLYKCLNPPACFSIRLSDSFPSLYQFSLFICLCMDTNLPVVRLPICPTVFLSVCLSVILLICLYTSLPNSLYIYAYLIIPVSQLVYLSFWWYFYSYLFVSLILYLSVFLSFTYPSVYSSNHLATRLTRPTRLFICLPLYLFVYLSIVIYYKP